MKPLKYAFILKNKFIRFKSDKAYRQAINYQYLSVKKRKELELNSRILLVEYAYNHCSFYKEYYDSCGFHPSMLLTETDWEKVPILEKWMIRKHGENMISKIANHHKLSPSKTGGSTGKPLVVYKSRDVHFEVLAWRALNWYGIGPWMNEAIVHRRVPVTFKDKLINQAMWWPTKRAYLCATRISEAELDRFVKELKSKKIKWIVGYCGSLEYVADYILAHMINITEIKLVWSTSSPLTKIVRNKLEKAFHCPVMDQYGCCEMGNIAVQKPGEDYLTVNNDYVWVDIVNGKSTVKKGELGDVCITDLHTYDFPLIKYRLGDRTCLLKDCFDSEDGFQKIAFVQGRTSDMLYLPNGDIIDGSFLTTICDNYSPYISCYQIYQSLDYNVVFRVIPQNIDETHFAIINKIADEFRSLVKNLILIKVEITDKIDDFAGKRKFIISDIALSKLQK